MCNEAADAASCKKVLTVKHSHTGALAGNRSDVAATAAPAAAQVSSPVIPPSTQQLEDREQWRHLRIMTHNAESAIQSALEFHGSRSEVQLVVIRTQAHMGEGAEKWAAYRESTCSCAVIFHNLSSHSASSFTAAAAVGLQPSFPWRFCCCYFSWRAFSLTTLRPSSFVLWLPIPLCYVCVFVSKRDKSIKCFAVSSTWLAGPPRLRKRN